MIVRGELFNFVEQSDKALCRKGNGEHAVKI